MQAVLIEDPGFITVDNIDCPQLADNEVQVKPRCGGICGTDVHIFEGNFIGSYPVIPCHEFAGEVVAAGKDVKRTKIGDKVIIDPNIRCGHCKPCRDGKLNICENFSAIGVTRPGGFGELVSVPEDNVYKFENCSFEAAAFCEPLACVLYGQSKLNYSDEQSVIIWGAGAIGLLHLMVCKNIYGCRDITVVDLCHKNLEKAARLGAKNTVLADSTLETALSEINNGKFDLAIEATGNIKAANSLFNYLGRGGQALLFGVYDQKAKLTLSPFEIFINDWDIKGSLTYNYDFKAAVKALDDGVIKPEVLISRSISLAETPDVIKRMAFGERLGKVQVKIC
ncbi:alcohol dehydrogenase catalytic domain-containing protein [Lentisphaerota bacterium ZTH]|nr:alcohol dehydrogenase catalytic domain-containing protein [Lentisphaerota bacterium]WET07320.1 alcohol dehydrogenase catalytic domain-containing protein [Lentisphaerota bacterium ZTH]